MPIISLKNVSKSYGTKKVLDDISFDIKKGDIFGLLGSNGAGKSTLTKILLGFEDYAVGKIKYYDGKPTNLKSKIAVVPQNIAAYLDFTVQQNMDFFASLTSLSKKERKDRTTDLIDWLELKNFRDLKVRHLSGGYQRLVNMALSIISNPDIIFLDEPTVGLDPKMRQMFWDKLNTLKENGKTLILTTHYMDEAEKLCTNVALLKKGKLITTGSAPALIRKYGGENIMVLELDKELDQTTINAIVTTPNLRTKYDGKKLYIAFPQTHSFANVVNTVKKYLVDKKYEIISANLKEPTLEDVFLNLTGEKLS
jgi:ABC-2 type transport system ATP-binding protein